MNEKVMDRIDELMGNDVFCEAMERAQNTENMVKLFADHGVTITGDEIKELYQGLSMVIGEKDEELKEGDLELISGGCIISWFQGNWDGRMGNARKKSGWHIFYNWGYNAGVRDSKRINDALNSF